MATTRIFQILHLPYKQIISHSTYHLLNRKLRRRCSWLRQNVVRWKNVCDWKRCPRLLPCASQSQLPTLILMWLIVERVSDFSPQRRKMLSRNQNNSEYTQFCHCAHFPVTRGWDAGSCRVKLRKYKHSHSVQRSWTWVPGDPMVSAG